MNALGGCCGSRPDHIAAIVKMASPFPPREKHGVEPRMRLSGLEPMIYEPNQVGHMSWTSAGAGACFSQLCRPTSWLLPSFGQALAFMLASHASLTLELWERCPFQVLCVPS